MQHNTLQTIAKIQEYNKNIHKQGNVNKKET